MKNPWKNADDIYRKYSGEMFGSDDRIVHCIHTFEGYIELDDPVPASQIVCKFCGCENGYTCMIDKERRSWMCGRVCRASKLPKDASGAIVLPKGRRAVEWPLFCEMNDIGDVYHDVCFDSVNQSQGKIDYLRKFCANPMGGIIVMYGPPGTGKTYASMGSCELFTRTKISAKFFTHNTLASKWIQSFRDNNHQLFVSQLERVELLVIDDFGTSEPSEKFMAFMMNLIDSRIKWKDRGTIISTNLEENKLSEFCGHALSDRLKTGQKFLFEGSSRRNKVL